MAKTLTGVLLDVSGSMHDNAGVESYKKGGLWIRSIFKVIDSLIEYDVSPENYIFSVGVGANGSKNIFDIIKTIDIENKRYLATYDDVLEEFFQLVEQNGATTIRKWAPKELIQRTIHHREAVFLLNELKLNEEFLKVFVRKCLPPICRNWGSKQKRGGKLNKLHRKFAKKVSQVKTATESNVLHVVAEATRRLHELQIGRSMNLIDVGSIFSIGEASEILHVGVNESKLNDGRINEIMKAVEPFIYGSTPLFQALNKTWKIFADRKYTSYEKVLFVLSDGEPTDRGDIKQIVQLLERYKVTVVSCYINRHSYIQPRRLYSVENGSWNKGAKFLFKLSSTISSQLLPRTIFIKTGWEIDIDNNETKLFLQINHEDNIHDACSLVRNAVCCQDSLSDLLALVSLDVYINQNTSDLKAKQQEYSTCYANATATVLHLSMMRIIGRDGGHPTFNALRNEIIKKHGIDGAYPFDVLEGIAPKYRLQFQTVSAQDAMIAVASKRPVIASFYLTNLEWKQFSAFYERQPTGILSKAKIDLRNRDPRDTLSGHAVVLTSFNSKSLRFMNSWGSNWANMGFFRVQNSEVLDFDYIDVFWTLNDLSEREIKKFEVHGAEVACKLINNLKSLQKSVYRCPICRDNSLVTAYSGSLKEAVCPKCKGIFQCNDVGNILALNIYLTSLIR